MKGFVACVLARVPDFVRAATNAPVHLAFSYDEELGCLGTPDLADALANLECTPALCLVGEPTSLRIVRAHKGKRAFRIQIKGRSGHSASPRHGLNAARIATLIAGKINDLEEVIGEISLCDPSFDPPHSTVHIGSLHGGGALNIIPDEAMLEFELRNIPGVDADEVLCDLWQWIDTLRSRCQEQASEADIIMKSLISYPPLSTANNENVSRLCARIFDSRVAEQGVSYGTEAGLMSKAGTPTIICGPGDMRRAHKANEWIALEELASGDRLLTRLARQLGKPIEAWN